MKAVSIPSNRGKPSDYFQPGIVSQNGTVSIPSNRGKPADMTHGPTDTMSQHGLNPLKSGQAFGQLNYTFDRGEWTVSIPSNRGKPSDPIFNFTERKLTPSQSPQIGASLRTQEQKN